QCRRVALRCRALYGRSGERALRRRRAPGALCRGRSRRAGQGTAASAPRATPVRAAKARAAAAAGTATGRRSCAAIAAASARAAGQAGRRGGSGPGGAVLMSGERERALAEIAFCEAVLAKGGLNVLSETFAGVDQIAAWDHYPAGDVFDPASNAQWFYHCHPAEEGAVEHGHFHCFLRPDGPGGPIHHLAAIGVDGQGQLLRLFTVKQWVVG